MKIVRYISGTKIEPSATLYGGEEVENYITQVYASVKIIDEKDDGSGNDEIQYTMGFDLQPAGSNHIGTFVDSADFVVPDDVMEKIEAWWNAEETINKAKNMFKEAYRPAVEPTFPEPTEEEITL
jgi:hypothetical protein